MKKLLLLGSVFLGLNLSAQAQSTNTAVVVDTLHYYFNKYFFKTGELNYANYPVYRDPSPYCKNAVVTHIGSRFDNAANNLTITGIEAFVQMPTTTGKPKYPVHMYLCNLNAQGMPILPPIDSVVCELNAYYKNYPKIMGGDFATPQVVTGDFAVLLRNMSDFCSDTVYVCRTAGLTNTFVANQSGWTSARKYSDGNYGFIRYRNGNSPAQFYSTQDFSKSDVQGFGVGTDYEFMVAPRVTYEIQASQQIPQSVLDFSLQITTDTMCTRTPLTFTNTSSWQFSSRFFNLNEFYRKWNLYYPFVGTPASGFFSPDSSITWNFEFIEQGQVFADPRLFLPYAYPGSNVNTVTTTADLVGSPCWDNQFRAKLRPMSPFGRGQEFAFVENFRTCFSYCGIDDVGIAENSILKNVRMFPNPSSDRSVTITGLVGNNEVVVTNIMGQVVRNIKSSDESMTLNLSDLAPGSYVVKITNENKQTNTGHLILTR